MGSKHTLVVLVHGTILPLPSPSCILSSLKDGFKKSRSDRKAWSDYYYEELRYKTLFKYQPIANLGLEATSDLSPEDTKRYPYAKLSSDLFKNCYNFAYQENGSNLHTYTFGWDGRLNQESRVSSAKTLYQSLLTEIDKIKGSINSKNQNLKNQSLDNQNLEIILIGHSHGGNVLLNLVKAEEEFKRNLKIDKLILVGTPVQSETAAFINDTMFKKVYSFYSNNDMIQVMDIVSTQDDISKRRFNNSDSNSNLVQIELKVGNKKPRHNELWLFGNSFNPVYRKSLAIYPLPAFVFIPAITNSIDAKYPDACEMSVNIDKNKNKNCFTIKLESKDQTLNQNLISIPAEILECKSKNLAH